MSNFEKHVYSCLCELFQPYEIIRQLYINYNGYKLFFDFYIKHLNLYIECQGEQHDKFVRYFHGSVFKYRDAKLRDKSKTEYVKSVGGILLCLYYNEYKDLTPYSLMEIIHGVYTK